MSLSVKVYLSANTDEQEIRRFSIDEGASASFTYVKQKIESVFPSVRGKEIRLFWKDQDNELVTFSTGEELVEALGSIEGDVFRIYVKVIGESPSHESLEDESSSGGVTHTNVICDVCDVVICGTRFKCAICPDYDLCAKCERRGNHNHHEMLRICFPRQHPWYGGGPAVGCAEWGFGPWGRGGQWFGRGRGRGGPCGPRGRGHCGGPRGRCGNGASCQRHQGREDKKNEVPSGQSEVPVGPPFLHSVGEALAAFLDPLGVGVHTYADNEAVCCQGKYSHQDKEGKPTAATAAAADAASQSPVNDGASTSGTSPMDTAPEHEDYVVVDKSKEKANETEATAKGAEGSSADDAPVDPLEVAIAQMQAMGFEDDSGWLVQLLKSKNYDISKVLDAIHFEGNK